MLGVRFNNAILRQTSVQYCSKRQLFFNLISFFHCEKDENNHHTIIISWQKRPHMLKCDPVITANFFSLHIKKNPETQPVGLFPWSSPYEKFQKSYKNMWQSFVVICMITLQLFWNRTYYSLSFLGDKVEISYFI